MRLQMRLARAVYHAPQVSEEGNLNVYLMACLLFTDSERLFQCSKAILLYAKDMNKLHLTPNLLYLWHFWKKLLLVYTKLLHVSYFNKHEANAIRNLSK